MEEKVDAQEGLSIVAQGGSLHEKKQKKEGFLPAEQVGIYGFAGTKLRIQTKVRSDLSTYVMYSMYSSCTSHITHDNGMGPLMLWVS